LPRSTSTTLLESFGSDPASEKKMKIVFQPDESR